MNHKIICYWRLPKKKEIKKMNNNINLLQHFTSVHKNNNKCYHNNWRGVWNKALSDFWCNVKFSSSSTTEFKELWKENLVIYHKSLKAFLQAPLQLLWYTGIKELCCSYTSCPLSLSILSAIVWNIWKSKLIE